MTFFWLIFSAFCFLMVIFPFLKPTRKQEAKKLDEVRYAVLEENNAGQRSWVTPFDIKRAHDAYFECVWQLQRDADTRNCTIFLSKNGATPKPLWTISRADPDILLPRVR